MDRDVWTKDFRKNATPPWKCGTCGVGFHKLNDDSLRAKRDAASAIVFRAAPDDWLPDWDRSRFIASFTCTHCSEHIVCAGVAVSEYECDEESGPGFTELYHPEFFAPPPRMISVPDGVLTDELNTILNRAFSLYWQDPAASVSKLCVFLELFLTTAEVPDTRDVAKVGKPTKAVRLNLHDRIDWFSTLGGQPRAAKFFLAMKYLGNEGSHDGAPVTRAEVIDSLAMLEAGLATLDPSGHRPEDVRDEVLRLRGSRHRMPKAPTSTKAKLKLPPHRS